MNSNSKEVEKYLSKLKELNPWKENVTNDSNKVQYNSLAKRDAEALKNFLEDTPTMDDYEQAFDGNFTINIDIDRIFIDKYHIKELLNLEEFNQEYDRIKNDVLNLISNFDEFSIKVNYDYDDIYPICLKEKETDKPFEVKRVIGTKINSINSTTELKDLTVESLLNIINYLC